MQIGFHAADARSGVLSAPGPDAAGALPEQLWGEHGWALGGRAVAALVGAIVAASCAVHLFG